MLTLALTMIAVTAIPIALGVSWWVVASLESGAPLRQRSRPRGPLDDAPAAVIADIARRTTGRRPPV